MNDAWLIPPLNEQSLNGFIDFDAYSIPLEASTGAYGNSSDWQSFLTPAPSNLQLSLCDAQAQAAAATVIPAASTSVLPAEEKLVAPKRRRTKLGCLVCKRFKKGCTLEKRMLSLSASLAR